MRNEFTKVIIVFCEGDHDIAILSKILSIDEYASYNKEVKDFPYPFNEFYIKKLEKKTIENIEFKYQRPNKKIPYTVLFKKQTFVIFHNLDGDGNFIKSSNKIIEDYCLLNEQPLLKRKNYDKINYRFLYFLDADDKGVDKRLNTLKEDQGLNELKHHQIYKKENFEIGCYVFHNPAADSKEGDLEDLLLSLMKKDNETIFNHGEAFIDNNILNEGRQHYFKKKKAIISIAGQLQYSGSTNATIIAKSDYITEEDIKNNDCCCNIMKLFESI